jgi:GMP synthase-like glutamine amidotransferase
MGRGEFRVGIVDMNAGHTNQAIRCLHLLVDGLEAAIATHNPGLAFRRFHVSPRDKGEVPPDDCDLYLCSGGPGSPFEGDGERWVDEFYDFLDGCVDDNVAHGGRGKGALNICYSFELAVRFFDVAEVAPRTSRKFGVMPVYTTEQGRAHPLLSTFKDRLFAFEHRNWEAVHLDESALAKHGGKLLARESRDGVSKGEALLAFEFAPGVEGVQFHPEADRPGVMAWVANPEQAEAFKQAYGVTTYERMLKTLDDPSRLARTFALLIPSWMVRRFNMIGEREGWKPLPEPTQAEGTYDDRSEARVSQRQRIASAR